MSKLLGKIRRKFKSLVTSRVESEDAMSTHDASPPSEAMSTHDASPPSEAMSTRDSSPPSETTDPCCDWCSRISLRQMPDTFLEDERERLQELFHSDCKCRYRENALPSSVCGFCKHLNIRHLVCCVLLSDTSMDALPTISSDWYCQKNLQNGCQLCEYIASYGSSKSKIGLFIFKTLIDLCCAVNLQGTYHFDDCIHFSQELVPQLQEHVNWEQIRGWLCEMGVEAGNVPDNFRVIDVERNCVVTPDYPVDYVALSYVWGNSSQKEKPFQASTRNIEDLEIEGSLLRAPLPRTITDAMEVCRKLDRQYLWVDRLCIIQDHESKHCQIQHMDSIFGSSEFTIIALSGQDASYGLPGVSEPRQLRRLKIIEWQGIILSNRFPIIQELVRSSYWAGRGWTFQEELCSRNNLYFTEYGVYHSFSNSSAPNAECVTEISKEPTQLFEFPGSVEAYAARSFTDPGDVLRAFTGVLNRKFGHDHYFGNAAPKSRHSGADFYKWIHWQPVDKKYEARRPPKDVSVEPGSHVQSHKTDIFPSWSWTSVQGGVRFHRIVYPVALWAFPVAQHSQDDRCVEWVSKYGEADRLRQITVEGRLMKESDFPFQPTHDEGLISASSTFFEKADRDEAHKRLGRILSFTLVASLRLENLHWYYRNDGRPTFYIVSSTGEFMGGIWLPELSLGYIFNKDGGLKKKEVEFMALSVYEEPWEKESILNNVWLEKNSKGRALLNVMLICRTEDSNVARRLGIGQVFKKHWFLERPVLKTVILE